MAWAVEREGGTPGTADEAIARRKPTVSGLTAITFVAGVAMALRAGIWFLGWIAPGELIWPISPDVYAAMVFIGVFLLILAAARAVTVAARIADDPRSRRRRLDALVAAPILLFMILTGFAQIAVQVAGFAGLDPVAVPIPFAVVGVDDARPRGGSTRYYLQLRYGAAGRVFDDRVPEAVHDAARAGDTVMRPVETGRFGLQRAMVAAPLTVGDLHHHD